VPDDQIDHINNWRSSIYELHGQWIWASKGEELITHLKYTQLPPVCD